MLANKLEYGDTIGIIMPASGEDKSIIDTQLDYLRNCGFKIKVGKHIYEQTGFLAGEDSVRAQDIEDMFSDKEISMVMCYRGGYGTMRLLPLINLDIVKNNPKIFIGYSDITTLLNYFTEKCGLITFHGPMAGSNLADEFTYKSLINTLMNGVKPYCIETPNGIHMDFIGSHSAEGILVGGNLTLISSTLGTPYEINTDNKILFLEDVGEEPYRIDRMLTQLLLTGKLQKCRGFILGQFTNCESSDSSKSIPLSEVIKDRLLKLNKPIILNFMSGHDYPKLTLPLGVRARIDCISQNIHILEPVVK